MPPRGARTAPESRRRPGARAPGRCRNVRAPERGGSTSRPGGGGTRGGLGGAAPRGGCARDGPPACSVRDGPRSPCTGGSPAPARRGTSVGWGRGKRELGRRGHARDGGRSRRRSGSGGHRPERLPGPSHQAAGLARSAADARRSAPRGSGRCPRARAASCRPRRSRAHRPASRSVRDDRGAGAAGCRRPTELGRVAGGRRGARGARRRGARRPSTPSATPAPPPAFRLAAASRSSATSPSGARCASRFWSESEYSTTRSSQRICSASQRREEPAGEPGPRRPIGAGAASRPDEAMSVDLHLRPRRAHRRRAPGTRPRPARRREKPTTTRAGIRCARSSTASAVAKCSQCPARRSKRKSASGSLTSPRQLQRVGVGASGGTRSSCRATARSRHRRRRSAFRPAPECAGRGSPAAEGAAPRSAASTGRELPRSRALKAW